MTPREVAIGELEAEIAAFKQGTKAQPPDGSAEWFRLRALTLGLAYINRLDACGIAEDPAACERLYRGALRTLKAAEPPLSVPVLLETLNAA